ncbi:MAG TPA: TMEM14 family protein [Chroococcidiopsis sp.]
MINLGIIAAIAYGILAIGGGVMGYIQAKSKISLAAGCGCGVLLLVSALLQTQGYGWGLMVAVAVTVVLLLAFTMRLLKTRKFMPAGLMLILGVPSLGVMMGQLIG